MKDKLCQICGIKVVDKEKGLLTRIDENTITKECYCRGCFDNLPEQIKWNRTTEPNYITTLILIPEKKSEEI